MSELKEAKAFKDMLIEASTALIAPHIEGVFAVFEKTYAPQSDWISVGDRLPDNSGFVIARSVGGDTDYSTATVILYFSLIAGKGREFQSQNRASHTTVTHWMPLPTAPKGE